MFEEYPKDQISMLLDMCELEMALLWSSSGSLAEISIIADRALLAAGGLRASLYHSDASD